MADHNTLTGTNLHEPRNIDSAGTVDAGKVLTPSASVAGEGVLRSLVETEVNSKTAYITARFADIASAGDIYIPMTFAGTVTEVRSVIAGALGGTDTVLTCKINGTSMTNGAITIAFSGSAAGDMDLANPTALNVVAAGQYLQVTTNAAGTGPVVTVLMFSITRT